MTADSNPQADLLYIHGRASREIAVLTATMARVLIDAGLVSADGLASVASSFAAAIPSRDPCQVVDVLIGIRDHGVPSLRLIDGGLSEPGEPDGPTDR